MAKEGEELVSERVAAESRTYFFDVKESVDGVKYLTISESRRSGDDAFERSRVMIFEEHISDFYDSLGKAVQFIVGRPKAYSVDEMRQTHPKAYAKWTEQEESLLKEGHAHGMTINELSDGLYR